MYFALYMNLNKNIGTCIATSHFLWQFPLSPLSVGVLCDIYLPQLYDGLVFVLSCGQISPGRVKIQFQPLYLVHVPRLHLPLRMFQGVLKTETIKSIIKQNDDNVSWNNKYNTHLNKQVDYS